MYEGAESTLPTGYTFLRGVCFAQNVWSCTRKAQLTRIMEYLT